MGLGRTRKLSHISLQEQHRLSVFFILQNTRQPLAKLQVFASHSDGAFFWRAETVWETVSEGELLFLERAKRNSDNLNSFCKRRKQSFLVLHSENMKISNACVHVIPRLHKSGHRQHTALIRFRCFFVEFWRVPLTLASEQVIGSLLMFGLRIQAKKTFLQKLFGWVMVMYRCTKNHTLE